MAHRRIGHRRPGTLETTERARRDGGYILVKFAFLLIPLLLMAGLSVDVGFWYNRVADIQKAADAAALAGVVWLPDLPKARQYATEAATRNGYTDGISGVEIEIEQVGERRLRVTITQGEVGSFFWENLGGHTIDLERSGLAEYVMPVPLGSPRNYFGTGKLPTLGDPELLYQSVNPSCTSKVNGDRHQSPHYNPLYTSGNLKDTSLSSCSATPTNVEYRPGGYDLIIEAPTGRSGNIDVMLYDPRYNDDALTWTDGEDCVTEVDYNPTTYVTNWTQPSGSGETFLFGPALYQTRDNTGQSWNNRTVQTATWGQSVRVTAPNLIRYRLATGVSWSPGVTTLTTASSNITLNGPAMYQERSRTTDAWGTSWSRLDKNQSEGGTSNRMRYRTATLPNKTTCTPRTFSEGGIDTERQSGEESYTFTLYSADDTPLDVEDNPVVTGCSKIYSKTSAFDDTTFLGSKRWNKLCTITTDMPSGQYLLRVKNGAPGVLTADGSNQWGLVAKYSSASGTAALCDARVTAKCPRVYGRDAISVYANTDDAVASFYLAEIDPEHAGKTLQLELWDPGEGGNNIQILRPTGTNSWTPATFRFTGYNDNGTVFSAQSADTTRVDVTSSKYNGKLLRIDIPLTSYNPPTDNRWWKIQYTFGDGDRDVTDRTTWSAKVLGDPVHLLEEEAP